MKIIVIILCAAIMSGCASAPIVTRVSDTLWPEVMVDADKDQVRDRLTSAIVSNGGMVEQSSDSLLQVRTRDPNAVLSQTFFGCPACGDPFIRTSIVFSELQAGTHVVVQYWRIVPKFGGAEQQITIHTNEDYNNWQSILWKMRDEFAR